MMQTWLGLTRQPTDRGLIIRFKARPPQKGVPPTICRDHPGVLWHQYLGSVVHEHPLQTPVPAEAWACHPTMPAGRVLSRTWHTDGRLTLTQPVRLDDDDEQEDAS